MIPIARPFLDDRDAQAAAQAITSGWVTQGPKVQEFEQAFAGYVGADYACAVSSCTTALHLALLGVGVQPGDAVITVSHSFIATANAPRYCGAEPVFIDIGDDYNLSCAALAVFLNDCCHEVDGVLRTKKDQRRIAALLVVHQMGLPCDLRTILPLAKVYGLPVVEDAACAAGSEISFDEGGTWEKIGRPHGDVACFSFHPRKVLTCGEGGMITCRDPELDRRFRLLRHHGMDVSDLERHASKTIVQENYVMVGYNYRMTDIQAAIGIEQLRKAPELIARRQEIIRRYEGGFASVPWLTTPSGDEWRRSNGQSYPVRLTADAPITRDALMAHLLQKGIASRPGIMNAHQQPPYVGTGQGLLESEAAREQTLLLPIFFQLTDEEIRYVISTLCQITASVRV